MTERRNPKVPRLCTWRDCGRPQFSAELCQMHYSRQRNGRDMDGPTKVWLPKICTVPGCASRQHCKEMCKLHYERARKGGTDMDKPARRKKFPYGEWHPDESNGYISRTVSVGIREYQHRYVMEVALGRKLLPAENIHHRNGDRSDNRIENLELWNTSQPPGQRAVDKLKWAREIIDLYGNEDLL